MSLGRNMHAANPGGLFGRDSEIAHVLQALQASFNGRAQLIFLSGEPGIGKSALLDHIASVAEADGVRVLRGACYEDSTHVAFVPLLETLRHPDRSHPDFTVRIAQQASSIDAANDLDARRAQFEHITQSLVEVAAARPLLLLWDDVHWIDDASAAFLRHFVRSTRAASVTTLIAYRDSDVEPGRALEGILREFSRERTARRVHLGRLPLEMTHRIIERTLGSPAGSVSTELARIVQRESEGVPFFTEELTLHLMETRALSQDEAGRWQFIEEAATFVPQSVRAVIGHRLSRLSPETRDVLASAAVIGTELPLRLVLQLLGVSENEDAEEVSRHLELAEARRLLTRRDGRIGPTYVFAHQQIRDVLYLSLNPIRRRSLHQRLASVLESEAAQDHPREAARLAYHFGEGQDASRAIRYAVSAARGFARQHAVEDAIYYYQSALDALDALNLTELPIGREQIAEIDLLLEIEPLLVESRRDIHHAQVIHKLLRLLASSLKPSQQIQILRRATTAALRVHDLERARTHALEAMKGYTAEDPVERAELLLNLAQVEIGRPAGEPSNLPEVKGDLAEAELLLRRAVELVDPVAHPQVAGRLFQELGTVCWERAEGDRDARAQARGLLITALEHFRAAGDRKGEITALIALAYRRGISSRNDGVNVDESYVAFLEEIRRLRSSEHMLARRGERDRLQTMTLLSVHVFCRANGWYETARERATQALELAVAARDQRAEVVARLGLAETDIALGRFSTALEQSARAALLLDANIDLPWEPAQRDVQRRIHAATLAALGDRAGAEVLLRERLRVAGLGANTVRYVDAETDLAEFLVAGNDGGQRAEAERLARSVLSRCATLSGALTWDIRAELVLCELALLRGDATVASGHAVAASARLDARDIPLVTLRMRTWFMRARALRMAGSSDDAREALGMALSLFETIVARMSDPALRSALLEHPHTREMQLFASALGIALEPTPTIARTRPAGLTLREIEVLKLVAAGQTNREIAERLFISEKTVARHLTNLFGKIDTQSRTQAAAWAFRHNIV